MLPAEVQSTGSGSLVTWGMLIALAVVAIVFIRRSGSKQVERIRQQQEELRSSLRPGTWVRTTSGFFGKIVEVTGEVVTLSNLTGEETLWDIRVVAEVKEPNFGIIAEESSPAVDSSPKSDSADAGEERESEELDATGMTPHEAVPESDEEKADNEDSKQG
ncbi:preprotein translocase subunit YajC [Mobiluncus mulieris]